MSSITKVAIVTGASSGIGRQTSIALVQEGYSVVLAGRRADALETTAEETGGRQFTNPSCTDRCDRSCIYSKLICPNEGDLWQA